MITSFNHWVLLPLECVPTNQPTFYGHFQKVNIYFLYEHQSTTTINIIDPRNASVLNAARTQLVNILHDILTNKAINFLTKQNSRTTKKTPQQIYFYEAPYTYYTAMNGLGVTF